MSDDIVRQLIREFGEPFPCRPDESLWRESEDSQQGELRHQLDRLADAIDAAHRCAEDLRAFIAPTSLDLSVSAGDADSVMLALTRLREWVESVSWSDSIGPEAPDSGEDHDDDLAESSLERCESPMEEAFLEALWACAPPTLRIRQQVEVGRFRVDFWLEIDGRVLVVEVDGQEWQSEPNDIQADKQRDRFLLSRGLRCARFTGSEVNLSAWECAREAIDLIGPT